MTPREINTRVRAFLLSGRPGKIIWNVAGGQPRGAIVSVEIQESLRVERGQDSSEEMLDEVLRDPVMSR